MFVSIAKNSSMTGQAITVGEFCCHLRPPTSPQGVANSVLNNRFRHQHREHVDIRDTHHWQRATTETVLHVANNNVFDPRISAKTRVCRCANRDSREMQVSNDTILKQDKAGEEDQSQSTLRTKPPCPCNLPSFLPSFSSHTLSRPYRQSKPHTTCPPTTPPPSPPSTPPPTTVRAPPSPHHHRILPTHPTLRQTTPFTPQTPTPAPTTRTPQPPARSPNRTPVEPKHPPRNSGPDIPAASDTAGDAGRESAEVGAEAQDAVEEGEELVK